MECEMCKNIQNPIEEWDKPLFESQNFVSFPSVGAFVEGYMLVLPRDCHLSMAEVGSKRPSILIELVEFTYMVANQVREIFGPDVCIYEHGPRACSVIDDSCTACIDHAHFHVVPIPKFNLMQSVLETIPQGTMVIPSSMGKLRMFSLHNYLYLEHPIGQGMVMVNDTFESQLIRRVIANHIGIPEEFNWRKHPQFERLNITIRRIKDALSNKESEDQRLNESDESSSRGI